MKFIETRLKGAYIIKLEKIEDERGFFARSFCKNEFSKYSLKNEIVQCNISYNKKKNTLRGMHFQIRPYAETKIVTCISGAIFDVIIDLRKDSATYCHWISVELTEDNGTMLYIPEGFAHGFQTLTNNSTVYYQMTEFFHPEAARGVRWDDPAFGIDWPEADNRIISKKDWEYIEFKI